MAVAELLSNFAANPIGYREGRTVWKFWAPLIARTSDGRVHAIPAGFEYDGASVWRDLIMWNLFGGMATIPSAFHDYYYRTDSSPVLKKHDADWVFLDLMYGLCDPPECEKRDAMYRAVRIFGGSSYHVLTVNANLLE